MKAKESEKRRKKMASIEKKRKKEKYRKKGNEWFLPSAQKRSDLAGIWALHMAKVGKLFLSHLCKAGFLKRIVCFSASIL